MRNKKGFTLAEVITAIGVLVMVVSFAGIIFSESVEAYRIAGANAEIMQKLQTITTQLDRDFSQVRRDGLLEIRVKEMRDIRSVTQNDIIKGNKVSSVWMDRIYYFTTGDFQSWFDPGTRNNIARVFWGHDRDSLDDAINTPLNQCRLARDVSIFTPMSTTGPGDCNNVSFVKFVSDISEPNGRLEYVVPILDYSVIARPGDANSIRQIMCENVGELKIEWIDETDGVYKPDGSLNWLSGGSDDKRTWQNGELPKAIKFTFTLYDSKEILKEGRRFTHIVYLGN